MHPEIAETLKVLSITILTFCVGLKNKIFTNFLVEITVSRTSIDPAVIELIIQIGTASGVILGALYTLVKLIAFLWDRFFTKEN